MPLVSSFKRRFDKPRLRQQRYQVEYGTDGEYDPVNQCIRFTQSVQRVPVYYDDYSLEEVVSAAGLVVARLLESTEVDVDDSWSRLTQTVRRRRPPTSHTITRPGGCRPARGGARRE